MSGDYTRFTFDPKKSFSGVLKQQGRVSLDSDWNESEELVDRRLRSGLLNILASANAPRAPTWTDFNRSDPGITLVEFFTLFAESLLWQIDEPQRRRRRRRRLALLIVGTAGMSAFYVRKRGCAKAS